MSFFHDAGITWSIGLGSKADPGNSSLASMSIKKLYLIYSIKIETLLTASLSQWP